MPGWELLGEEEKQAVDDIFDKSNGILYRYAFDERRNKIFRVDEFERLIAEKVGSKYALMVCNGTAALKLCLIALGVKAGDEIITQSHTFIATVEAILELGAKPIITEVDNTLNMDPLDLRRKITSKTKAIIPVHMFGSSARMDEIMEIAREHHIKVLEDSAQALGASYQGKNLGTIGDMGIYSLDIGKIITTGEGGVLVTNDEKLYLKAREYADHGHEYNPTLPRGKDTRSTWGFNYKVSELQGAIGIAQLKKINTILQQQKENKKKIKEGIKNIPSLTFREHADEKGEAGDTLIFFLENREKAEKFAKLLAEKSIGTKCLPDAIDWHFAGTWTQIFHHYEEYKQKNLEEVWVKSSNNLRRAIAIPVLVKMDQERINMIINSIQEIMKKIEYN